MTDRFEAIGTPTSAEWMSGTIGDERVPGPSTYWIDAFITLDAATAEMLRTEFGAIATDEVPDVVEAMASRLPSGPLLTSDELSQGTGGAGMGGKAYIAVDSDQLVIIKVGGPN